MVRTPSCDKSGLRKGTWTPEEDQKLIAYVTRYGCWNWRQLPKFAGLSRCGKSCRLRWMNYLRPNVKRGNYSKEEDELILKLHESLGNRWSAIASHLPGRSDNEIKNHWHTALKKNSKKTLNSDEPNSTSQDILESSHCSSEKSSTDVSISTVSDNEAAESSRFFEDLDDFVSASIEESVGNFWAEPFFVDDYSILNFSPSPLRSEEFLCGFGLQDEHFDSVIW